MKSIKKILIVDIGKNQGGIERLIYNIYMNFPRDEYHFDFLVFNDKCAFEEDFINFGSKIFRIAGRKKNPLLYSKRLKFFLQNHSEYDFVWIQSSSASNIMAHLAVKKYTNAILITHAHVTEAETKNWLHYIITKVLHKFNQKKLRNVTDIAFGCSEEAILYLFGCKMNKATIIKNGINLKEYSIPYSESKKLREKIGIDYNTFVLGHVGRFAKIKNHRFIIDVFYSMYSRDKNVNLLLVGDGEEYKEIVKIVNEKNISDKVFFVGEQEKVAHFYGIMDAFIFPSIYEGFGIAAIEAQAAGVVTYINESLPSSLNVTKLIKRLPLEDGAQIWADTILKNKKSLNNSDSNSKLYTYDICETVKQIEKILNNYV